MNLLVTRQFESDFKKIPIEIKLKTEVVLGALKQNPFSPALKIKKLKGLGKNYWRVKIDRNYRLIYTISKNTVIAHRLRHRKNIYRSF